MPHRIWIFMGSELLNKKEAMVLPLIVSKLIISNLLLGQFDKGLNQK